MKKKTVRIILLICALVAALCILVWKGVIKVPGTVIVKVGEEVPEPDYNLGQPVLCLKYSEGYLSLDQNKKVAADSSDRPWDLPEVEGIEFTELVYGKEAVTEDVLALDYAVKVAKCIKTHNLRVDTILLDEYNSITLNIGNLRVKLGKNEKTEEKINDLNDFYDEVSGMSGVLYMQEANANNFGYTFRQDAVEEKTESEIKKHNPYGYDFDYDPNHEHEAFDYNDYDEDYYNDYDGYNDYDEDYYNDYDSDYDGNYYDGNGYDYQYADMEDGWY